MSNVQIRNVPEDLHRRLRARAALEGRSVSDLLLEELERFMSRPSKRDVLDRISGREPVHTTETSARAIAHERARR